MTCLMFPFGDASWHPLAVDDAVEAAVLIVSAAALFVAPAAATVSRHPSASAQRTPILRLLIGFSPLLSMIARKRIAISIQRQRPGRRDPVARRLKAFRPCGAEEPP